MEGWRFGSGGKEMEFRKSRLLIIEDDEEMRSLLEDYFGQEGYEVISVCDGAEALSRIRDEDFDLIITDIRMPAANGLDVLSGLRTMKPAVPAVVITAGGSDFLRERALALGASRWLEKPIHLEEFGVLLRKLLSEPKRDWEGEDLDRRFPKMAEVAPEACVPPARESRRDSEDDRGAQTGREGYLGRTEK